MQLHKDKDETIALWRNRNYLLLQGGQLISFIGDQQQFIALPLLVLALTGSAVQTGLTYSLSAALPFLANAISFGASTLSLSLVRGNLQSKQDEGPRLALFASMAEGFGWLWKQPLLRFLPMINGADSLRYGAGYLVIIMLARELHTPASGIGAIFTGAALGALLGNLASNWARRRFSFGKIAISMLWLEALMFRSKPWSHSRMPKPTSLSTRLPTGRSSCCTMAPLCWRNPNRPRQVGKCGSDIPMAIASNTSNILAAFTRRARPRKRRRKPGKRGEYRASLAKNAGYSVIMA
jgi:hypothetical protein